MSRCRIRITTHLLRAERRGNWTAHIHFVTSGCRRDFQEFSFEFPRHMTERQVKKAIADRRQILLKELKKILFSE